MTAPSDERDPWAGRVFGGRYTVLSKLGEGGVGAVYKGVQSNIEQLVAIKLIRPDRERDEIMVRRFHNEAKIYARINSPYVVQIHEFGQEEDGTLYLVMAYLPGVDLRIVLSREGALPLPRLLRLANHLLEGLSAAHAEGIVHRDIKPANIMVLDAETDKPFAKLLDFGLGKARTIEEPVPGDLPGLDPELSAHITQLGHIAGTPRYMSPEQWLEKPIDHRSDLYAAGVVLFEMASGGAPFQAAGVYQLGVLHAREPPPPLPRDRNLPSRLNEIIQRCLQKDPDQRYQSARDLVKDLEALESEALAPEVMHVLDADERYDEAPLPMSRSTFGTDGAAGDARDVVQGICATLGKAYKSFSMYPADNPVFGAAADEVVELLDRYFDERDQLALNVDRFAVYYGKFRVYEDTDLRLSYPFKLFTDGIRRLYFLRGLGREEVLGLFDCLRAASVATNWGEDLVTLLWERRLQHVRYHLVEDLVEEGTPLADTLGATPNEIGRYHGTRRSQAPAAPGQGQRKKGDWKTEEAPAAQPTVWTPRERRTLEVVLRDDADADHLQRFIGTLVGVLLRSPTSEDAESLAGVLSQLVGSLLGQADVEHAMQILGPARKLRDESRHEYIRESARRIVKEASQPQQVGAAVRTITTRVGRTQRNVVGTWLALLDHDAVPAMIEALDGLDEQQQAIVQTALLFHCKDEPLRLESGIESRSESVVVATLRVLALIDGEDSSALVESTLGSDSRQVKREALKILRKRHHAHLGHKLREMLQGDPTMRVDVIEAFADVPSRADCAPLLALVDHRLYDRPHDEQVAVFHALEGIAAPEAVDALARLLVKRDEPWYRLDRLVGPVLGALSRKKDGAVDEATPLAEPAAQSLRRIGSDKARRVLEKTAKAGSPAARRACRRALERLRLEPAEAGG